jgi:hypothetical protein
MRHVEEKAAVVEIHEKEDKKGQMNCLIWQNQNP